MANGIDQTLLSRGTRGSEIATAPTLFQQTIPGLFAGSSQLQFDETQGGRFKKFFFGGLFGPTKKEREANAREQSAEKAAVVRRTQGIAGQLRTAGRGDVLQFPAARDAVRAAALGEEQGLSDVASLLGSQTEQQRAATTKRQVTADQTAEQQLADAQLAAQGGRFGSDLTGNEFRGISEKVGTQVAGASSLFNIADTIENLTDVEMAAIGSGTGGEIQGQIEAELFALLRPMQTLIESGEGSVLRKSDQELIEGILENPDDFLAQVFSRESKTLAKLRRLGDIMIESAGRSLTGLDQKTIGLMAPVLQLTPSKFTRPEGKARDAPDIVTVDPFPGSPVPTSEILEPLQEGAKSILDMLTQGAR